MSDLIGQVDIAFVIDSTGSMMPYIEEAKRHARVEADRIARQGDLDIRLALVAYRDHPPQDSSFVTQVTRFTGPFDLELTRMAAAGGGDRPEAVWDGVMAAINLDWREGADHIIFLIGDSPPHGYQFGGVDAFPQGCPCGITAIQLISSCTQRYIKVNAHSIAGEIDTTRAFTELTQATGGECTVVNNPTQSTAAIIATTTATSASVADSRDLTSYYTAHPTSTPAEAAVDLGWKIERVNSSMRYLGARGIDAYTGISIKPKTTTKKSGRK